ncbi:MAG: deoxyribose-phosphate aldolase [Bacteroidales bacterium]|nr:deoxyribose-phosphate aldolase [Bacteroidales bacterium]
MDKYLETLGKYDVNLNDEEIKAEVEQIVAENFEANNNVDVLKFSLGCIDLTTLNPTDNEERVRNFTQRVNDFEEKYPELDNVASICVYPNFAEVVNMNLDVSEVHTTVVAAGFPSSQTFNEIKVAECALAVASGADEVDIVIGVGQFLQGAYEEMCDTIAECKAACKDAIFKVILETGALKTASNIMKASILAIYSGADFIKTSTGKLDPAATPEAVFVMCKAAKAYYEQTGNKIGIKVAGGVRTPEDAVKYYCIVKSVLGEEWLTKDLYRIGASSAANNLLSAILGEPVKHFL